MSLWSDGKIMELLERMKKAEERLAVLERERADEKKPDRAPEARRTHAR